MATVKVNRASIDELKSAITFSAEQTSQAADLVAKAVNGISGMSFSAKYGLESDLTSLKTRLNKQAQLSRICCQAVQETVDLIVQVDDQARITSDPAWSKVKAQVGTMPVTTAAALIPLVVKEQLRRRSEINDDFIDGTSDAGVTSTPNPEGKTTGTEGNGRLPDWTKEYSDIYSQQFKTADGGIGEIATYNTTNYDISCTFYTLRKLRERGLGFPFQSSGVSYNGANWFDNCTDDVPKVAGKNAIETLLSGRDTLENVVVSFPASANTWNCGHVMLIDKVYKDPSTGQTMVSFSDNYDYETNQVVYGADGSSHVSTWSLDAFKNTYINFHGGINGAVLIGS